MSGASARLSRLHTPVETGTPPYRRHKFHITRFQLKLKAHSFHCASSSIRKRCAGLRIDLRKRLRTPTKLRIVSLLRLFKSQTLTRKGYAISVRRQSRQRLCRRGVLMPAEGEVPPPRRRVHFVAEQNGRKISLGASAPKYPGVNPETGSLHPARKI